MNYSKEFTEIIRKNVKSSIGLIDLISIEEISWSKDQNGVFVRTIARQKDESHCGHGIGIYFSRSRGNFRLLADGVSRYEPFEVIFKEIKRVLPDRGDFFTTLGTKVDYEDRIESEVKAHHKAKKKIKYLEAKLFIKEYEEDERNTTKNSLPF